MRKSLIKIIVFVIIVYFIGEGITRIFKLTVDTQNIYQDTDGLIKNEPNQTGYYVNGNKWVINKYGEFGYEPQSLDSLIMVIGDSFLVNKMNPPECHQASYLASMTSGFNFYPSGRDNASFIELMERTKSLNHLNPIIQLLYVHDSSFISSVKEIKNQPRKVQLSIISNKITYPKLTQIKFKKILRNFKFAYYLYRKYLLYRNKVSSNNRDKKPLVIDYEKIKALLDYVNSTYLTDNMIFVFSPDSDAELIEFVMDNNFQTITLTSDNYKSWQLPNDSHWSCYGQEEAAKQVAPVLNKLQVHNRIEGSASAN